VRCDKPADQGAFVGVGEADAHGPEDQHDDGEEDGKYSRLVLRMDSGKKRCWPG